MLRRMLLLSTSEKSYVDSNLLLHECMACGDVVCITKVHFVF